MRQLFTFNYHILRTLHTKIGRVKYSDFEHPTCKGVNISHHVSQGAATLALGYVLVGLAARHWWSKNVCLRIGGISKQVDKLTG